MKQIYGNATIKIIIMNHNDNEYLWKEWQAIHQNMKLYINQVYERFNFTHQGPPPPKKVEFIILVTPKRNGAIHEMEFQYTLPLIKVIFCTLLCSIIPFIFCKSSGCKGCKVEIRNILLLWLLLLLCLILFPCILCTLNLKKFVNNM